MKCRRCGATIHISKRKSNLLSVQKSYPERHMSIECTCYLCDACLHGANQRFDDLIDFMRGVPEEEKTQ